MSTPQTFKVNTIRQAFSDYARQRFSNFCGFERLFDNLATSACTSNVCAIFVLLLSFELGEGLLRTIRLFETVTTHPQRPCTNQSQNTVKSSLNCHSCGPGYMKYRPKLLPPANNTANFSAVIVEIYSSNFF